MLNLSSLNNLSSLGKGSARPWYKSGSLLLNGVAPTLIHDYANNRYAQYENVTNYVLYSQDITNAAWGKTRATATGDVAIAPDGTMTADSFIEDTSVTLTHALTQSVTGPAAIGDYFTYSVYVKDAGRTQISLKTPAAITTTGYEARYDMMTGTVSSIVGGYSDTSFTYEGNGWWRCSITAAATVAAGAGPVLTYLYSGGTAIYTGDGVSGVYLWGAQLEYSNNASPYQMTTSASASMTPALIPGTLASFDKFSRLSNATMIDAQSRLVWGNSNLLRNSEVLTAGGWGATRATSVLDGQSPVGDSYKLTEDTTATSTHVISQTPLTAFVAGASYTFSMHVHGGTRRYVALVMPGAQFSGVTAPAYFDTQLGVWGHLGGHTVISQDLGGGWYRLSVTATCTTAAAGAPVTYLCVGTNNGDHIYTGDGASYIYVSCAQLELTGVDSPKPWVQSLGNAEFHEPRRDYDPVTGEALGFIAEEARTNVISDNRPKAASYTSSFVTFTETGTILGNPAVTMTTNNTGSQFFYPSASTLAASTLYTSSMVFKKGTHSRVQLTSTNNAFLPLVADAYCNYNFDTDTFTVGGSSLPAPTGARQLLGDGSVRLFLTYTSGTVPTSGAPVIACFIDSDSAVRLAGTATVGATVLAAYGQCEAGGWGTSIIPTFGVSATRATESLTVPVDSWYSDVGTFVVEYTINYETLNNRRLLLVGQAAGYTDVNGVLLNTTTKKLQGLTNTGGGASDFAPATANASTPYVLSKGALLFDGANGKVVLDGGSVVADAARTIPTPGKAYKMWVNGYATAANNVTGFWIKKIIFYPDASASDAQLQAKTV